MRVLLDECVDRRFAKLLSGLDVTTVPQRGWAGTKNGRLLALAELEFDVLVTVDTRLTHDHPLRGRKLAVVVLRSRSNALKDLSVFATTLCELIPTLEQGTVTVLKTDDVPTRVRQSDT